MRERDVSKAINPLVDAKYALGDPKKGWDCLNSLRDFYTSCGVVFPTMFRGYDESNYARRFKDDPDTARNDLEDFLHSLGSPVPANSFQPGDLMIFKLKDLPAFPGIYVGQSNVLLVMGKDTGIRVYPLQLWKKFLREVRRLSAPSG